MTIIDTDTDRWIEYHEIALTLPDAAGEVNSLSTVLNKNGRFRGCAIVARSGAPNDNTEAVGLITILNQTGAIIDLNTQITGIRINVKKQLGTAGATVITFHVLVFLSK